MLDFLTKYLRTDVRYIMKGGGVMILGQIGVSVVAVASSIAFANLLPKNDFGVYQYILATIEFILIFSLTGMGRAMTVSVSRGFDGSFIQAWVKSTSLGLPAVAVGLAVGLYYYFNGNTVLAFGIGLGTLAMLLITNFKYYISFLNGKKLFGLSSLFSFLNIFITSSSVITALFFTDNILIILGVFLTSNLIINGTWFWYTQRLKDNKKNDGTLVSRALHLSGQGVIGHLASQADRVMLFQFAGPAVLAEFWLAQHIQRQFSHLFKSSKAIVIPKISTQSISNLRKTLFRKILFLFLIVIPFTAAYAIAIPTIINLFFPAYTESILYAQFFGVLFLFLPFKILADVFVGHGMNGILYRITVVSSSLRLLTTVSLVPFFGIWGVIISSTLDQFIHTVIVIWYFYKLK